MIRGLSWALHLSNIIERKRGNSILVWRLKKAKKLDFALVFCCLDAVFSRDMENYREKAKRLGDMLLLQYLSTSLPF